LNDPHRKVGVIRVGSRLWVLNSRRVKMWACLSSEQIETTRAGGTRGCRRRARALDCVLFRIIRRGRQRDEHDAKFSDASAPCSRARYPYDLRGGFAQVRSDVVLSFISNQRQCLVFLPSGHSAHRPVLSVLDRYSRQTRFRESQRRLRVSRRELSDEALRDEQWCANVAPRTDGVEPKHSRARGHYDVSLYRDRSMYNDRRPVPRLSVKPFSAGCDALDESERTAECSSRVRTFGRIRLHGPDGRRLWDERVDQRDCP